jgi:transposase
MAAHRIFGADAARVPVRTVVGSHTNTSTVAHLIASKFALGVPQYRLERELADQGMPLDRGLMSRCVEHAGNTLGATFVHAMWRDAITHRQVILSGAHLRLASPGPVRVVRRAVTWHRPAARA